MDQRSSAMIILAGCILRTHGVQDARDQLVVREERDVHKRAGHSERFARATLDSEKGI
jgi:hypothetical protein